MNRVYLDLETTGLNPDIHEIIECAVIYDDDTPSYHRFIRPNRIEFADKVALKINRFHERAEEWNQAISQCDFAFELAGLLKNKIIIGHNPFFDYSFIKELFEHYGEGTPKNQLIDTKTLAFEHLYDIGLKRLSLDSIRVFMGWSLSNNHTALKDAHDTKMLYTVLSRASFFDRLKWKIKAKRKTILK